MLIYYIFILYYNIYWPVAPYTQLSADHNVLELFCFWLHCVILKCNQLSIDPLWCVRSYHLSMDPDSMDISGLIPVRKWIKKVWLHMIGQGTGNIDLISRPFLKCLNKKHLAMENFKKIMFFFNFWISHSSIFS